MIECDAYSKHARLLLPRRKQWPRLRVFDREAAHDRKPGGISTSRFQPVIVEHGGTPLRQHVTHGHSGLYHTEGNRAWAGGTQERAGWDAAPGREGRESILQQASRLLRTLGPLTVREHLCGFRPMTPDGLPILGRVPGWENVVLATGAGSKGMLLGAGMGECAADLVIGRDPAVDLRPFRLERFVGGSDGLRKGDRG
jgi:glycine/D-amino acid oxidase-like deaminating enzyme